MNDAGFDVVPMEMDLSSRDSILNLIAEAQKYGSITKLVNGPRGDFYKNMFAKCPAGRPGTATASYYYGPLKPQE